MKHPLPRIDKKRKQVCLYNPVIEMFQILHITDKGLVNKRIAFQYCFTNDVREAFRKFEGCFYASTRSVSGLKSKDYKTWNEYAEAVWIQGNTKKK